MVKITSRLWLTLALLLGTSLPLFAQQTTGNISGRALDPQGAAMPGVTVTAKNPRPGTRAPSSRMRKGSIASRRCRSAPTTSRSSFRGSRRWSRKRSW